MKNSTHGKMENDLWFPESRGQLGCLTGKEKEAVGGKKPGSISRLSFVYTVICQGCENIRATIWLTRSQIFKRFYCNFNIFTAIIAAVVRKMEPNII